MVLKKKVEKFSVILKTGEELNNIKNLKTFNQIKEFTDNFNYSKTLTKKDINLNYLYNIFLSIVTQKEKNILTLAPILDLNKDEITKLKENTDEKKIEGICNKIRNIIYKYSVAFENIEKPDIDEFDEFILKNQLSFDYTDTTKTKEISEKKEELKKLEKSNPNDKKAINELNKTIEELIKTSNKNYFDDENKIVKKYFEDKSLNNMTLSTVFSSKKDEDKVAAESPKLLALLNRFKGSDEENKNMLVRKAVNIIIDFLRLRKNLGYTTTTEKREIDYKSTKDEREKKIKSNIEKLNKEKTGLIANNIDTFKKIDEIYNENISPADAFKEAEALIQKDTRNNAETKKAEQKLNDYNILSKEIKALQNTMQSTNKEIKAKPEKLDKKKRKDESDKRAKEIKTKFEKKAEENKNKFATKAQEEREAKIEQIKEDFSTDNENELENKESKKIDKNIFIGIDTTYNNSETQASNLTKESLDEKYKTAQDLINKQLQAIESKKEANIYKEIEKNLYIYNNLKFELAKSDLKQEKKEEKMSGESEQDTTVKGISSIKKIKENATSKIKKQITNDKENKNNTTSKDPILVAKKEQSSLNK